MNSTDYYYERKNVRKKYYLRSTGIRVYLKEIPGYLVPDIKDKNTIEKEELRSKLLFSQLECIGTIVNSCVTLIEDKFSINENTELNLVQSKNNNWLFILGLIFAYMLFPVKQRDYKSIYISNSGCIGIISIRE
jgi:hypothetical protein